MSDWVAHYRSVTLARDVASASSLTEEAILIQAGRLNRHGHEVHRIEGPDGQVIGKKEIEQWMAARPE